MKKTREFLAILLALCIFTGITYGMGGLLLPERHDFGATWSQFLQEEKDSLDVLYFGSSIVYCDVIPAVIWKESGLTSYVMAGPEQAPSITYHYLRQACKTQSPQAVVVELNGLYFPPYTGQMKPNLLYMPWGTDRVLATFAGSDPKDHMELLFPLYSTHDRVYTISWEETAKKFSPQPDSFAGYTLLTTATSLPGPVERSFDPSTETYRDNMGYLRKIAAFCAQRDIKLVLYLAPVYSKIPEDTLDALRRDLRAIPHALFFNCNDASWPDFDPEAQWFDFLHLNLYGAVPFSRRMARELDMLGLEPAHRNHDELWQDRYELIEEKLAETREAE